MLYYYFQNLLENVLLDFRTSTNIQISSDELQNYYLPCTSACLSNVSSAFASSSLFTNPNTEMAGKPLKKRLLTDYARLICFASSSEGSNATTEGDVAGC